LGLKGTQLPLPMPKPKWPKRSARLVTALMCKNERAQIAETTLDSLKEYCGHLIVYDTGSTDGTQNHIREYCAKNDIQLDLKEGPFVDFAVSRNVLLDYCDELLKGQDDKFILQVDAHDVLQGGDKLIEFITTFKGPQTGFYLTQKWWSGSNLDSYYNVRMIKPHKEWRYNPDAIVHEYIVSPAMEKDPGNAILKTEGIILYQDRTAQGDSSFRRFMRDKEMLFRKYLEKPAEPRTLFYLAQTQGCLGLNEEAYKFYQLRIKQQGFFEEIYHSYFRLGDLSVALGHNWEESMNWYWRAFQHSQRAEPLVRIAEYYEKHNLQGEDKPEWHSCYFFAQMATQLAWPQNQILFRDLACYTYKRYHLLGIAGFYVGKYREGKEACLKAIEARNLDVDKGNLRFYLEKEIEIFNNGKLDSPSVFASTFGETEIRTKEEIEINHDRTKVMNEIFSQILADYTNQGRVIPAQTLQSIGKLNNGLVINASQKGNSDQKVMMENVMYGTENSTTSKRSTRNRLKGKLKK
jgi:glycosyltransferase involved in cell wall biosynthesis